MLRALMWKELLCLTRDLHGFGALFIMPLVFIVVMSLALKNVYSPPLAEQRWVAVVGEQSEAAETLVALWSRQRGQPQPLPADWRSAVARGQIKYALVIEEGFGTALKNTRVAEQPLVRLVAEPGLDSALYNSSLAELRAMVAAQGVQTIIERMTGMPLDAMKKGEAMVVAERLQGRVRLSSVQHSVPAWLVFGMFFVVAAMGSLFVQERADGTLARLASLGVPRHIMILSKALPYLLVNCLQAALMLAVGRWLMPLLGGEALSFAGVDFAALALAVLAIALAAVSFALLLSCLARSHTHANAIGPLANVVMAALGGIMVPTFVMPEMMQRVAAWSPMNWALESLLDVLVRGATPALLAPRLLPLIVFAALMLGLAVLLFNRRMR